MFRKWLKASAIIPLIFYGCSELLEFEPVIPSWESVFSFKLASEKIILGEAIKGGEIDTLICGDPELCDSLRGKIFLFTQTETIEPTLVGDQLNMDDIHQRFSQSVDDVNIDPVVTNLGTAIGIIDLGTMDPVDTPPFAFSSIMPTEVYDLCSQALESGANSPPIDPVEIVPDTNEFSFDDFDEANLQNALIKLEIFNDMFIYIGNPVTIELQDTDYEFIGQTIFSDPIPPGGSDSAFINLQNQTLPGDINVIVSGTSLGSNEEVIPNEDIDLESSFRVSISVQQMSVTSATAQIPSQTIGNDSEMQIDQGGDDDEKVIISSAEIKEGQLAIEINNSIPLGSTLILSVPNLTYIEDSNTLPLYEEILLTAGGISENPPIDLSGYTLTMDPDSQKIEYSYTVITEDTSPDMVTIDQADSVNVNMVLSGITEDSGISFSTVTGIFQKGISTSDEISIDSGTKLLSAEIDTGSIVLEIENNLNLEAEVVFSLKEFLNGADTLVQEFDLTSGENTNSTIDLSGYTITFDEESVLSGDAQVIHYTSDVTMGEEEMTLNLEDSLVINVDITALSFVSISGILDTISVDDSMSIGLPEYPVETTQLEGLGLAKTTITIEMISGITVPVEIDLNLTGMNSETGNSVSLPNFFPLDTESDTTRVVLENTEDLINIFPDTIFADIHAVIGGGNNIGSVSQSDSIQGMVYVEVPLAFVVQDSVRLELDHDSLGVAIDDTSMVNNIQEVIIEAFVENSLDLSIELMAIVDQDTLFENPDTLIDGFSITGGSTDTNQVVLDDYFIDLFTDELYMKNIVTIRGNSDSSGTIPSVLYTTDSLTIDLKGSVKVLIDSTLISSEEE